MATATLKASLIEAICTKRIDGIEAEYEAKKEEWFKKHLATPKTRGRFFCKHQYYPTQAEVEADFYAAEGWCGSPHYYLGLSFDTEKSRLIQIAMVAKESQSRGDGKITLNAEEIHSVRLANHNNGDVAQPVLEAA